jgi:hypothetical protein
MSYFFFSYSSADESSAKTQESLGVSSLLNFGSCQTKFRCVRSWRPEKISQLFSGPLGCIILSGKSRTILSGTSYRLNFGSYQKRFERVLPWRPENFSQLCSGLLGCTILSEKSRDDDSGASSLLNFGSCQNKFRRACAFRPLIFAQLFSKKVLQGTEGKNSKCHGVRRWQQNLKENLHTKCLNSQKPIKN